MTLSNIFTMRLIGNKTHGDLAEIAIAEFINQYMYDYKSLHVGKDLFRSKKKEEDISVTNEITGCTFPVSLKAYGIGPLQLSTDKDSLMFPLLNNEDKVCIDNQYDVKRILSNNIFTDFQKVNVLPLIYDEKKQNCNILVFNYQKALSATAKIIKVDRGHGRQHPIFQFIDTNGHYICEVRYGDARANALQRGLWTNTKNALNYFSSVTNGWIDYSHNKILVQLFSNALISSELGHKEALKNLQSDIERIKREGVL